MRLYNKIKVGQNTSELQKQGVVIKNVQLKSRGFTSLAETSDCRNRYSKLRTWVDEKQQHHRQRGGNTDPEVLVLGYFIVSNTLKIRIYIKEELILAKWKEKMREHFGKWIKIKKN